MGVFICDIDQAKGSFYKAANAMFGKVGRLELEEITLQLIKTKCIPMLLYGLHARPLIKSQIWPIDFVVNRFFMKLFNCTGIKTVKYCQEQFGFELPSDTLTRLINRFLDKLSHCANRVIESVIDR